jgi:polyhydroxyalkanoate synthesis regulator phasin
MPQPKSAKSASTTSKPTAAKGSAAKKAPSGKRSAGKAKNPSFAGKKTESDGVVDAQAVRDEALRANLVQLRELLAGGVMLTAQRVQEAMDDAVRRGKMTRRDAEEIARGLVDTGRRQSYDLLADIEQLLERSRSDIGTASNLVRGGTDRVLREVDRVRRTAGVGPSQTFPIDGYEDLTAAEIAARLPALSAAELQRVRDHEQAGRARKSVLAKVDAKLK